MLPSHPPKMDVVDDRRHLLQTLTRRLTEEAANAAHSRADSFVLCVSSHGGEGYFNTADGERVQIGELTAFFDGRNCQPLHGKPKLFIIDACQGGMIYPT